ncbi:YdbT family protein [Legionella tunisiensis]|uniref:hypothetical protein n=1 Tax=Legionella tunisiensis TaxID=1034944 RepID=UPI0002D5DE26|nr:hypothetical protein [Legionella tunisiensis]
MFFDLHGDIPSADAMHEWMMSLEGMETIAATSVSLIVFSMLANYFRDDDKNSFKRYMAVVWPYCRDAMKGLKNAYKGVRSTFIVFELLNLTQDLHHLIVPVSLLLGGLSVLNRLWFRMLVGQDRKDMTRANIRLAQTIRKGPGLSEEEIATNRKKIYHHSERVRAMALLSAAYGGIVDGLYLYVGVLGICSLAPAVLEAMSVFCAIYFLTCVATRIYEEYNFQRLLSISEVRVELALQSKGIEALVGQLKELNKTISEAKEEEFESFVVQRKKLAESLAAAVDNFKRKREELRSLSTLSYPAAVLAGLSNGLAAYGALASAMFAVSTLLLLFSTAFPPNLLVSCIMLGMACLAGFAVQSVVVAHNHYITKQKEKLFEDDFPEISRLLNTLKEEKSRFCEEESLERIRRVVVDGENVEGLPRSWLGAWFEVVRSFFSGIGKGSKAVGFTLYSLQEVDEQGHYHDTPIMVSLMMASAVAHAIIFSLRAYARGLGRPPVDAEPDEQATPNNSVVADKQPMLDKIPEVGSDVTPGRVMEGQSVFGVHYREARRSLGGFFSASAPNLQTHNMDLPSALPPPLSSTQPSRIRRVRSYSSFFSKEEAVNENVSSSLRASDDLLLPSPYHTL